MAGTFTDKRSDNEQLYAELTVNENGTPTWGEAIESLSGSQITTSYRTNREQDNENLRKGFTVTSRNGFFTNGFNPLDNGHPFFTVKRKESLSHKRWVATARNGPVRVVGPLVPRMVNRQMEYPLVEPMSDNDRLFYGSKAIANTVPNNPAASLASLLTETALAPIPTLIKGPWGSAMRNPFEFRDGVDAARKAGSKYLEFQFGWFPLVSEITAIMKAVVNADKILRQYQRDSGRYVRRRFDFPMNIRPQTRVPVPSTNNPQLGRWGLPGGHEVSLYSSENDFSMFQVDSYTEKIYFRGAYSYYLDAGKTGSGYDKISIYAEKANKLLGLRMTPEILWELAPWSWLVDWKLNVGEAIANSTRFSEDSLVLVYGYLMREVNALRSYQMPGIHFHSGNPGTVSRNFAVTQKERFQSTPYGFGFDMRDISLAQEAILVALAASRGGSPR